MLKYFVPKICATIPLVGGTVESHKRPNVIPKIIELIRNQGWEVNNIDSVIVAERPKIKPFVELMKNNISEILQIEDSLIGIKATTNEKLGPEGREEGISCYSVVLLEKKE